MTVKLHLVYGVDMSAAEQQMQNKVTGNRESSSECGIQEMFGISFSRLWELFIFIYFSGSHVYS